MTGSRCERRRVVTLVRISATAVEETPDSGCNTQTFRIGIRGSDCVKRIQQAVGTIVDGWWGPLTNAAVLKYQRANGLPANAIWDADDWAKLEGTYDRPNPSFQPTPPKGIPGSTVVSILDVFPADGQVSTSAGWRYVTQNKKLPLPYPWNNGVWNPPGDSGYKKVIEYMNKWAKSLQ